MGAASAGASLGSPWRSRSVSKAVCAVASVVVAAGCSSHATAGGDRTPTKVALSWCGQQLLAPGFSQFGRQALDPVTQAHHAVMTNDLPPVESDLSKISSYSNLVIVSSNCAVGDVVVVDSSGSHAVRTVKVAHDSAGSGITALLLGRVNEASQQVSVIVRAYRSGREVGQAVVRF